jgi:CMP-N-acetylneuraminic acid synthetase
MENKQKHLPTIALICVRGGSLGLFRKNERLLAGKPLMAHTIEHALASGVCDSVIVSTEDEKLAQIAKEYGAEVPFKRPAELAQNFVPIEATLQHALTTYESLTKRKFEIVVYLQTTDIFRKPTIIKECVDRLCQDETLESVFSAYQTHKNFWRKSANGYERLASDITYAPRQKRELLYREDTGVALATRAYLIREGKRIGKKVDIVPTDDFRTSIDIHDEFSFWLAEKVLTQWKT